MSELLTKKQLGDELCQYCPLDDKEKENARCIGSICDVAYDVYKIMNANDDE